MKKARTILAVALVLCNVVGLIFMLFFFFQLGVLLWVLSTIGGAIMLYTIRHREELAREEAEAKMRADEEEWKRNHPAAQGDGEAAQAENGEAKGQ